MELNNALFYISTDIAELYLSLHNFFECYLEVVYLTQLGKFFKFMVIRLLENAFASQKMKVEIFN